MVAARIRGSKVQVFLLRGLNATLRRVENQLARFFRSQLCPRAGFVLAGTLLFGSGVGLLLAARANRLSYRTLGDASMLFHVVIMPASFYLLGRPLMRVFRLSFAVAFGFCWMYYLQHISFRIAPHTETTVQWCGGICGYPVLFVFVIAFVAKGFAQPKSSSGVVPGYCVKCGYNLCGLQSDCCPECGTGTKAGFEPGLPPKRAPEWELARWLCTLLKDRLTRRR